MTGSKARDIFSFLGGIMKINNFLSTVFFTAASFGLSANTNTLKLDTAATNLTWHATKLTGEHYGTIAAKEGNIEVKGNDVVGGKFEVDMDSFKATDIEDAETNTKFLGHLKSEDFFDVKANKTALLEIKKVTPWSQVKAKAKKEWEKSLAEANARKSTTIKVENPTHLITGMLTIKGKAVEQDIPAVLKVEKDTVLADGLLVIDRTRWGIKYGSGKFFKGLGDKTIGDKFEVAVKLTAKK